MTVTNREGGRVVVTHTVTVSDLVVNRPLPANIFTLAFPPGLMVEDRIRGQRYQSSGDGGGRSEVRQLRPIVSQGPEPAAVETLQADAEGWKATVILRLLAVILIAGGVIGIYRRSRRS